MKCKLSDIATYRKEKISISDIDKNTYISTENMIVNKGGVKESACLPDVKQVQAYYKGDILISNIRPYFKKIWYATNSGGCSSDILVIHATKFIDNIFLYYTLSADQFFDYVMSGAKGTKMPRGDKSMIMEYEISLFSEEIQRKIVKILLLLDRKIHLNKQINNNLEKQAVLLFKKWFTNFKYTSEITVKTEFGMIPTSFKLTKNGDLPLIITDYVANGSFASLKANVKLFQEENYAYFIRNTDLKSGQFEVFVDKHSYDFLSKSTLYGGEIIISNVGDVGSIFLCPKLKKPMTLGNNIIMIRPEQKNLQYYLFIWFKWLYGKSLIQRIKGGSAQPKFNKTDFKNLPIYLPNDNLLERFHQTVKPMFEKINDNNSENQNLITIRDILLTKLISGELDISDVKL